MKVYEKSLSPELQKVYKNIGINFIYSPNLGNKITDANLVSAIYQILYLQYNLLKVLNSEIEEENSEND